MCVWLLACSIGLSDLWLTYGDLTWWATPLLRGIMVLAPPDTWHFFKNHTCREIWALSGKFIRYQCNDFNHELGYSLSPGWRV